MSNKAMSWAIEVRGLPINTKAILMLLADCHNGSTGQCNPSMDWLEERSGLGERALQNHMKALEAAGLIEREYQYHGRGRGSSVGQFHLKIGITGAVLGPQKNAPAKECARKNMSMDPQNGAVPYKEEPEGTGKSKVDFSIFEEAWKLYQSCSLKASGQTKKKARDQWGRSVRKADPQEILKAIRLAVEARRAPKDFIPPLPDMFRWLKDERYADVLREAKPRIVETSIEDWKTAARNYVDSCGNTWPAYLGDPPHYSTCRAPDEILNRIRRLLADDPAAPKIPQRSAA
ncbi:helix-turn-helix domain-containing protein [Henriciella sp.]|uniref:helix-turn-helix domain-containing protein n=1 Tax=Henriciella sp. TaxID=1968823 RepID=UPI000C122428|nr:helix-turn-helix domain-containing protein [Henriciella sp.]PHR83115.1 MAG: hypothetical protein COA64_00220 [Henriciella sp.]